MDCCIIKVIAFPVAVVAIVISTIELIFAITDIKEKKRQRRTDEYNRNINL